MIKTQLRRCLPVLIFVLTLVVFQSLGLAEEEGAGKEHPKTVIGQIMEGGPLIMFIWFCILGTSVTMVTLIIQNAMSMRKDKLAPPPLIQSLQQTIGAGNYQEAWSTCNANKNYLANVLKAGLARIGRGKEAVEVGVAEHGLREATLLRTRNSYLSVIGVVSPMIGPHTSPGLMPVRR